MYTILVFQGSETMTQFTNFLDPAFSSNIPVDFLQPQCTSNSQFSVPVQLGPAAVQQGSFYEHIHLPKMFLYFVQQY